MTEYQLLKLPKTELNKDLISLSFNNLPADTFLRKNEPYEYRYRRYDSGEIIKSELKWDNTPNDFLQDTSINSYVGGVSRKFATLEPTIKIFVSNIIVKRIVEKSIPKNNYKLGVHQIRIRANDNFIGKPAPEGIHQDGFDYVAVSCIDLNNISGGTSVLVDSQDYKKIYLSKDLEKGETLVFNDKTFAHYASPIVPKVPGEGYRDVIVTTYAKI